MCRHHLHFISISSFIFIFNHFKNTLKPVGGAYVVSTSLSRGGVLGTCYNNGAYTGLMWLSLSCDSVQFRQLAAHDQAMPYGRWSHATPYP